MQHSQHSKHTPVCCIWHLLNWNYKVVSKAKHFTHFHEINEAVPDYRLWQSLIDRAFVPQLLSWRIVLWRCGVYFTAPQRLMSLFPHARVYYMTVCWLAADKLMRTILTQLGGDWDEIAWCFPLSSALPDAVCSALSSAGCTDRVPDPRRRDNGGHTCTDVEAWRCHCDLHGCLVPLDQQNGRMVTKT